MPIRITAFGGAVEVGGSCVHIEYGNEGILLDAGMRMIAGRDPYPILPDQLPVNAVLLSHAHNDHIGALPHFYNTYPWMQQAELYATSQTKELIPIMLEDAARVQGVDDDKVINNIAQRTQGVQFGREIKCSEHISCIFHPAGHIRGAASVEVIITGEEGERVGRLLYTGDVLLQDSFCEAAAQVPAGPFDLVIAEATHGAGNHADDPDREMEKRRLGDIICETLNRRGVVLIPSFALGRAQEVLVALRELREEGYIQADVPVYLSRGLAERVTGLCNDARYKFSKYSILGTEVTPQRAIQEGCCVIVASNGMLRRGTLSYTVAQMIVSDPNSAVVFPGFTTEESEGRRLLDEGRLVDFENGLQQEIACRVESVNFTAHSSGRSIAQQYAVPAFSKAAIFVHGDAESVRTMTSRAREHGLVALSPRYAGDQIQVDFANNVVTLAYLRNPRYYGVFRDMVAQYYGIERDEHVYGYPELANHLLSLLRARGVGDGEMLTLFRRAGPGNWDDLVRCVNDEHEAMVSFAINGDADTCMVTSDNELQQRIRQKAPNVTVQDSYDDVFRMLGIHTVSALMNLRATADVAQFVAEGGLENGLTPEEYNWFFSRLLSSQGREFLAKLLSGGNSGGNYELYVGLARRLSRITGHVDALRADVFFQNVQMVREHPEVCRQLVTDPNLWELLRQDDTIVQAIVNMVGQLCQNGHPTYEDLREFGIDTIIDDNVFQNNLRNVLRRADIAQLHNLERVNRDILENALGDYEMEQALRENQRINAELREIVRQLIKDCAREIQEGKHGNRDLFRRAIEFMVRLALDEEAYAGDTARFLFEEILPMVAARLKQSFAIVSAMSSLCRTYPSVLQQIDEVIQADGDFRHTVVHALIAANTCCEMGNSRQRLERAHWLLNQYQIKDAFSLVLNVRFAENGVLPARNLGDYPLKDLLSVLGNPHLCRLGFLSTPNVRAALDAAVGGLLRQGVDCLSRALSEYLFDRRLPVYRKAHFIKMLDNVAMDEPEKLKGSVHAYLDIVGDARWEGNDDLKHLRPIVLWFASKALDVVQGTPDGLRFIVQLNASHRDAMLLLNSRMPLSATRSIHRKNNTDNIINIFIKLHSNPDASVSGAWQQVVNVIEKTPMPQRYELLEAIGSMLRNSVVYNESVALLQYMLLAYIHTLNENLQREKGSVDYATMYIEQARSLVKSKLLNEEDRRIMLTNINAIRNRILPGKGTPERNVYNRIRQAINKRSTLFINYRDANENITNRNIQPMELVFEGRWFCRSFCETRNALRTFALSNMTLPDD